MITFDFEAERGVHGARHVPDADIAAHVLEVVGRGDNERHVTHGVVLLVGGDKRARQVLLLVHVEQHRIAVLEPGDGRLRVGAARVTRQDDSGAGLDRDCADAVVVGGRDEIRRLHQRHVHLAR